MNEHRLEYHQDLEEVRTVIVRLGALVTETIARGTDALLSKDLQEAQALIEADDVIDEASVQAEEQIFRLFALQQPMAGDLRFLVSSLRIIGELERSADLMVNICKAARRIYDLDFDPELRGLLTSMSAEATKLTRRSIDAYVDGDNALAAALDDMDSALDHLQVDLVEAIFTQHRASTLTLQQAVQLALICRYYERIGDHAVNIGERVSFMVTGWMPEYTGAARSDLRRRRSAQISEE